jgi:acyl-CoA dehydrogenase
MPVFKAPVDDTLFILNDVLGYERYMNLPGFADASPDIVEAILQEGARISEEVMLPAQPGRRSGRLHPARRRHGDHAKGLQGSLQAILRGPAGSDWRHRPEFGGQGLPYALHVAVGEYMSSANLSFMMYPGLTQGAIAAIHEHGSDEQKQSSCRR